MAAKLNQSIGAAAGGGAPPQVGPHAGLGLVTSEDWSIPNRVVGLGMHETYYGDLQLVILDQ